MMGHDKLYCHIVGFVTVIVLFAVLHLGMGIATLPTLVLSWVLAKSFAYTKECIDARNPAHLVDALDIAAITAGATYACALVLVLSKAV